MLLKKYNLKIRDFIKELIVECTLGHSKVEHVFKIYCIDTKNIVKCWSLSIGMCQYSSANDEMMREVVIGI